MNDFKADITNIGGRLLVRTDASLLVALKAEVPGALPDPIRTGCFHWPDNLDTMRALIRIIGWYDARLCKVVILDYGKQLAQEFGEN